MKGHKTVVALFIALAIVTGLTMVIATVSAGPGNTRYVSPSGSDSLNNCTNKKVPCQHIQYAVSVASAGDTISLDKGIYIEQVTIDRSLTLVGAGVDDSVIKAPGVLLPDTQGRSNIVEINNASTVNVRKLTVTGPGPGPCGSIDSGIAVIGGATLNIDHVAVRDVRDNPLSGCQNGHAIRVGTQNSFSGPADVGHLFADHTVVTGYQKTGIIVNGVGSTGIVKDNTIQSSPTVAIASNGIQIASGAVATVEHNTVTGNECDLAGICGPDWFTQSQASGVLVTGADSGTTVLHNDVFGNDLGVYADSGGDIEHNDASANRYFGLILDTGYTGAVRHNKANGADSSCPSGATTCDGILVFATTANFENNSADRNGNYGIEVFTPGNTFDHNEMKDNATFDAIDYSVGIGTAGTGNTWTKNNCNSSSPPGLCK